MTIDIVKGARFMTTHGRLIDRRRFIVATGRPSADDRRAILAALDAYRNPDGGFGWGLEPDCRAPESQPAGALHALEAVADAGPEPYEGVDALLAWLDGTTLADGGLPFALPVADPTGCAPFWVGAGPRESSLQITAAVTAQALRVAAFDGRVRNHPWLERATGFCLTAIQAIDEQPPAYVLSFSLAFLDAAAATVPRAAALLTRLGRYVPADGRLAVDGGAEGETLRLLDVAPRPGRPVRGLLAQSAVDADFDRLASGQQDDGGWTVDFDSFSPRASLDWRGYVTVSALSVLRDNHRV